MSFLKSEKTKRILINIGAFIALVFILFFAFSIYLRIYTHHGESLTVPDFMGKTIEQAKAECEQHSLQFMIRDSIFDFDKPKLSIVAQNPRPGSAVKEGRRVYFTINMDQAPTVTMLVKLLVGEPRDQAVRLLTAKGLREGRISYKPDMALNIVLAVMYKGRVMNDGELKVDKGVMIDLVLGDGGKNKSATVPNVIGQSLENANLFIKDANLNLGTITHDDTLFKDSLSAMVFKQYPPAGSVKPMGEPVFLWITPANRYNRLYGNKLAQPGKLTPVP